MHPGQRLVPADHIVAAYVRFDIGATLRRSRAPAAWPPIEVQSERTSVHPCVFAIPAGAIGLQPDTRTVRTENGQRGLGSDRAPALDVEPLRPRRLDGRLMDRNPPHAEPR